MRTIPCKLIAAEEVEHITEKKANRHWFEMSIAGDSTDGIVGVKGTGMVTATKLLADTPDTIDALWSKVAETYTKKGYTLADAILNARLTRILREGDYDYNTGTVKLWKSIKKTLGKRQETSKPRAFCLLYQWETTPIDLMVA